MKIPHLLLSVILAIPSLHSQAADKPQATYEEQQAQINASYKNQLPSLPAGAIKVVDQVYVDHAQKGIAPDSSQKLDLFVPAGNGPFPLIINIHGGGWHAGGKLGGISLARIYLPKQIAVASLNYRWVQDASFPAQIEDCNAAIAWLRSHASQYHLNPDKIGLTGHSAGAHLCAMIAATGDGTTFKNPQKVQAAVCAAGPFDLDRERGQWPKTSFLWNARDAMFPFFPTKTYDGAFARYASPQSYIHRGIPPILIVHGDKDTLVPLGQAQSFASGLKQAGVDATFRVTLGRDHGSVMDEAAKAESIAFFEKHLAAVPASHR